MKKYFDDSNFPEWTKSNMGITVPLSFPEKETSPFLDKERDIVCLLCEDSFSHPQQEKEFLKHMMVEHRFVISEVQLIADLPSYVAYWRNKFIEAKVMTDYCTVIRMKMEGEDTEHDYFLLSDIISEDKELRIHLQMKKLEHVLEVQEKERRNTTFKRNCFFCRTTFEGSHATLFNHMAFDHNFSVGQPDNLVYVVELLDMLESKLDDLVCIFCEKVFKSRDVLKEHMRKKNHKKINPRNSVYDKYYLVNYLEFGKSWAEVTKERDYEDKPFEDEDLPTGFDSDHSDEANENDWSDWRGNLSGAVCLFCAANYTDITDLLNHMNVVHEFNYQEMKATLQMNFYQQIKLINYIRRQMHLQQCLYCNEKFEDLDALFHHMKTEGHMKPPDERDEWDQSQFYFPTFENDNFLYLIQDDESGKTEEEAPIIAQDISVNESILFEDDCRKSLLPKGRGVGAGGKRSCKPPKQ